MRVYRIPMIPFLDLWVDLEKIRVTTARKAKKIKPLASPFISVNRMYPSSKFHGGKRLSEEGREYKSYIKTILGKLSTPKDLKRCSAYEVTYIFRMPKAMLITKSGELRDVDLSNMLKAAEDALFDFLKEKDSKVVAMHAYKSLWRVPELIIALKPSFIKEHEEYIERLVS